MSSMPQQTQIQPPLFSARRAIAEAEVRFTVVEDKIDPDEVDRICKKDPNDCWVLLRKENVELAAKARAQYKAYLDKVITCEKALLLRAAMST